ncbi:MAG: hypothetical protein M1274_15465 [Actinobacteria bacterium]|nr:hypothetical protein [Actinomycetota bacterium]
MKGRSAFLDALLEAFASYSEAVVTLRLLRDFESPLAAEQDNELARLYTEFREARHAYLDHVLPTATPEARADAEELVDSALVLHRRGLLGERYAKAAKITIPAPSHLDALRECLTSIEQGAA